METHSPLAWSLALILSCSLTQGLAAESAWPTPPPAYPHPVAPAATEVPAQTAPATEAPAPSTFAGAEASAQDYNPVLVSRRGHRDPARDPHQRGLKLGGPRFGLSYANGGGYDLLVKAVHEQKPDATVDPLMTQFGWQMEYRMFRTDQGVTALSELIPLVGGLDQGLVLPSALWLVGLRNADGWELGVGPDFGVGGVSMMLALGCTFDMDGINVPLNLAVGRGVNETTSTCLSIGFNL